MGHAVFTTYAGNEECFRTPGEGDTTGAVSPVQSFSQSRRILDSIKCGVLCVCAPVSRLCLACVCVGERKRKCVYACVQFILVTMDSARLS